MKKILRYLFTTGYIKTIWFNFKYFSLNQAVCLPVLLDRQVKIKNCKRGNIVFCDGVSFGCLKFGFLDTDFCYRKPSFLNIKGRLIVHGHHHNFAPGLILYIAQGATIEMGDLFSVSHDSKIQCLKSIKIGHNNMWSYHNVIMDTDGHPILSMDGKIINQNQEVVFGSNIWMGCGTIILKGSQIPDNTVIAAGSVICKKLKKENSIISTNGIALRDNITWKRTLIELMGDNGN